MDALPDINLGNIMRFNDDNKRLKIITFNPWDMSYIPAISESTVILLYTCLIPKRDSADKIFGSQVFRQTFRKLKKLLQLLFNENSWGSLNKNGIVITELKRDNTASVSNSKMSKKNNIIKIDN